MHRFADSLRQGNIERHTLGAYQAAYIASSLRVKESVHIGFLFVFRRPTVTCPSTHQLMMNTGAPVACAGLTSRSHAAFPLPYSRSLLGKIKQCRPRHMSGRSVHQGVFASSATADKSASKQAASQPSTQTAKVSLQASLQSICWLLSI